MDYLLSLIIAVAGFINPDLLYVFNVQDDTGAVYEVQMTVNPQYDVNDIE